MALSGLVHTYVGIFKAVFLWQLAFYPHAIRFFFRFLSLLSEIHNASCLDSLKKYDIFNVNIVLLKNSTILRSNSTSLSVHTRLPLSFCWCCPSFFWTTGWKQRIFKNALVHVDKALVWLHFFYKGNLNKTETFYWIYDPVQRTPGWNSFYKQLIICLFLFFLIRPSHIWHELF